MVLPLKLGELTSRIRCTVSVGAVVAVLVKGERAARLFFARRALERKLARERRKQEKECSTH